MKIIYHHRTRSTDAQRIHILEIARGFKELGHEVEIVSLVPTDTAEHDAARDAGNPLWQQLARRIPFAYELVQVAYNLIGIPMLFQKVLRDRPRFIYERYSLFNFTGVLVAKVLRMPIVLEVNSPFAMEQVRDNDIRLKGFAQWTEKIICNLATVVIVVSTPLRRMLEDAGVQSGKMRVMTNGVRPDHFLTGTDASVSRQSLGVSDGEAVIGFVGWFRKWHGLENLLEAFAKSGLSGRAKVMLVGDGQAMPDLKRYVRDNHLENDVIFTGPLPHAQVPAYVKLIDIAVQPAANEYCCPMKILEYMAVGKPVVAPRQENILEVLREGEAQYFTPGDVDSLARALKALVGDPERARQMGERVQRAILERGLQWSDNAARVVRMVTL